jgi:hypothetical protein
VSRLTRLPLSAPLYPPTGRFDLAVPHSGGPDEVPSLELGQGLVTRATGFDQRRADLLRGALLAALPPELRERLFPVGTPGRAHNLRRVKDLLRDPARHGSLLLDGVPADLVPENSRSDVRIGRVTLRFVPSAACQVDGVALAPGRLTTEVDNASMTGSSHLGRWNHEISAAPQATISPGATGGNSQFAGTQGGQGAGVSAGAASGHFSRSAIRERSTSGAAGFSRSVKHETSGVRAAATWPGELLLELDMVVDGRRRRFRVVAQDVTLHVEFDAEGLPAIDEPPAPITVRPVRPTGPRKLVKSPSGGRPEPLPEADETGAAPWPHRLAATETVGGRSQLRSVLRSVAYSTVGSEVEQRFAVDLRVDDVTTAAAAHTLLRTAVESTTEVLRGVTVQAVLLAPRLGGTTGETTTFVDRPATDVLDPPPSVESDQRDIRSRTVGTGAAGVPVVNAVATTVTPSIPIPGAQPLKYVGSQLSGGAYGGERIGFRDRNVVVVYDLRYIVRARQRAYQVDVPGGVRLRIPWSLLPELRLPAGYSPITVPGAAAQPARQHAELKAVLTELHDLGQRQLQVQYRLDTTDLADPAARDELHDELARLASKLTDRRHLAALALARWETAKRTAELALRAAR